MFFFSFSLIFHFVFFFYRGNVSSRPQRASWPVRNHCFRAKLLLDQSDSWHSDLRCYQTNMVIGHELILSSSVFLGRTSCLITHSVWSFDYHFHYTSALASLKIGRALLLLCKHLSENFESEAKRSCGIGYLVIPYFFVCIKRLDLI